MAVEPDAIRQGSVVLVRMDGDKARPAVVVRSDLLAELPYATVLPITSELRADAGIRLDVAASPDTGFRVSSQVMVDWPQTVRLTDMGGVVGCLDTETMRAVTRQLAVVLAIGGTGEPAQLPPYPNLPSSD